MTLTEIKDKIIGFFKELRGVDVSQYTEKKGKFTYLSWAWAVDQLLLRDETATFVFKEPTIYADESMMVWCEVTAFGKTMTGYLPVLDHRNQPIKRPNAMQVNTAMQRCLTKTISLFGLGLYIYAGEDIPVGDPSELMQKTFDEQGREGALALYNKMSDAERAECKSVIQKIREGKDGTEK